MKTKNPLHQTGAALVVGLLLLVVLALISTIAMNRSILQERLAGGVRNATMAQYGAESALRDAEFKLYNHMATTGSKPFGSSPFPIQASETTELDAGSNAVHNFRTDRNWIAASPVAEGYAHNFDTVTDASLAQNPEFAVEYLGTGFGGGNAASRHIQFDNVGRSGTSSNDQAAYTDTLHFYRVTARSTGGTENLVKVLESTFVITD